MRYLSGILVVSIVLTLSGPLVSAEEDQSRAIADKLSHSVKNSNKIEKSDYDDYEDNFGSGFLADRQESVEVGAVAGFVALLGLMFFLIYLRFNSTSTTTTSGRSTRDAPDFDDFMTGEFDKFFKDSCIHAKICQQLTEAAYSKTDQSAWLFLQAQQLHKSCIALFPNCPQLAQNHL